MSDTQRGDISPTTGSIDSESLTDGGKKKGPGWEKIARHRIALSLRMFYGDEVATYHHQVTSAIEDGEDPTDVYWTMVSRFGEYAERVGGELMSTGDLDSKSPKVQLHSTAYYAQDRLLQLGKDIQNDSVDGGLHGDSFEAARHSLAQAEEHIDELEEEYRGSTEKKHKEQLEGIARRHPLEDDDE